MHSLDKLFFCRGLRVTFGCLCVSVFGRAAVAICVGIDFGVISIKTRLSDHAARSIV